MTSISEQASQLQSQWQEDPRWAGVQRTFTAQDVIRLRGSVQEEHTLARLGAERLWRLLHREDYVNSLGALTGNQAVQQVRAGLKAIYLSGWQVAADANLSGQTYPDQSLYPANSVPQVVRRINNALLRADQTIQRESGHRGVAQDDRRWSRDPQHRRRTSRFLVHLVVQRQGDRAETGTPGPGAVGLVDRRHDERDADAHRPVHRPAHPRRDAVDVDVDRQDLRGPLRPQRRS